MYSDRPIFFTAPRVESSLGSRYQFKIVFKIFTARCCWISKWWWFCTERWVRNIGARWYNISTNGCRLTMPLWTSDNHLTEENIRKKVLCARIMKNDCARETILIRRKTVLKTSRHREQCWASAADFQLYFSYENLSNENNRLWVISSKRLKYTKP